MKIFETFVILAVLAFLSSIVYLLINKLTFKVNYSKYDIKSLNKQQLQKEQHFNGVKTNYVKKTIDLSGVSKIEREKN